MPSLEEPLGTRLASVLYIVVFVVWSLTKRLLIHLQHKLWWPRFYPLPADSLDAPAGEGLVRCVRLVRRRKPDVVLPSSMGDFVMEHRGFFAETVVFEPDVTPYLIDLRLGVLVFVRIPPTADLGTAPFYYMVQYQQALEEAYLLPLPRLLLLSRHIRKGMLTRDSLSETETDVDPFDNICFVISTGRCGSTLTSKIFADPADCLSLSEPDVYTNLLRFGDEGERYIVPVSRFLFKPTPTKREARLLVVKFRGESTSSAERYARCFPNSHIIFMYRNGLDTAKSIAEVFKDTPLATLMNLQLANKSLRQRMYFQYDYEWLGTMIDKIHWNRFSFAGFLWAAHLNAYLRQQAVLPRMRALLYEDLVERPKETIPKLFDMVGVSYTDADVRRICETVMPFDAQEGTPLKRQQKSFASDEEQAILQVMAIHPVARDPYVRLPGLL